MYPCLQTRGSLNEFLSAPLEGKCTIYKSKTYHDMFLVVLLEKMGFVPCAWWFGGLSDHVRQP